MRLPQDGRPPAGPVPDRHFCHVVRDTATLNLRPLLAYADAAVARYYAGRPGVGERAGLGGQRRSGAGGGVRVCLGACWENHMGGG